MKFETEVRVGLKDGNIERICQEAVEEHWKIFLQFAAEGSNELGKDCIVRFEKKINDVANGLKNAMQRDVFLKAVEIERARLFEEYTNTPEQLKRRLAGPFVPRKLAVKTTTGKPDQKLLPRNLNDVAINTAVRATVWEIVVSIFRSLR